MKRRLALAAALPALAFGATIVGAPASSALAPVQSTWAMQTPATPRQSSGSVLTGSACPAPTTCVAVGYYTSKSHLNVPLAELWNGTAWSLVTAASPAGSAGAYLDAIACPTATLCVAVGSWNDSSGGVFALSEIWTGSSWSIEATGNPPGTHNAGLSGIACASASTCVAVGNYYDKSDRQVPLVESWNGSRWWVRTAPAPTKATHSWLQGVACPAANSCVAVGVSVDKAGYQSVLAMSYGASAWSVQQAPQPVANFDGLTSVSCASTSWCAAVGYSQLNNGHQYPLAELWNGSTWSIATLARSASAFSSLWAISCNSPAACMTVGGEEVSGGSQQVMAEVWNGETWTTQRPVVPAGGFSYLPAISCSAPDVCTAVGLALGTVGNTSLIERSSAG